MQARQDLLVQTSQDEGFEMEVQYGACMLCIISIKISSIWTSLQLPMPLDIAFQLSRCISF